MKSINLSMSLQRCIYNLLEHGADDWVFAAEVTSVAKWTGGTVTEDETRELSLRLIQEIVQQGLMEIGDLTGKEGRFRRWEISDKEALERVEREWRALGNPNLGDICWLCNTAKGDEIGKRLLDLWNAPQDCEEKLLMRSAFYGRIDLPWIVWVADRIGGADKPETKQELLLRLIREVVTKELMEIGEPIVKLDFQKWEMPTEAALKRLAHEWRVLGREPHTGEICWLRNTEKGNKIGERLLDKGKP